jgi:hypothetical protein
MAYQQSFRRSKIQQYCVCKHDEIKLQEVSLVTHGSVPSKAFLALFNVSQRIAQYKRPTQLEKIYFPSGSCYGHNS